MRYLFFPPSSPPCPTPFPLQVLNERFAPDLRTKLSCGAPRPLDELLFISIDATGVDIRVRTGQEFSVERIGFGQKVGGRVECTTVKKPDRKGEDSDKGRIIGAMHGTWAAVRYQR